jgi:hypothetical protein
MEKNKNKIKALKEQRAALVAKSNSLKEEYLTTLLKQLDQPYMVFDNKIIVIPTSSPMFELLPQTSYSNSDFGYWAETDKEMSYQLVSGDVEQEFKFNEVHNYALLLIDLAIYKIDKVKDTFEYINEQKELI